jgi:hypothetical protein
MTGRSIHRSDGKTDAEDAGTIADQVRMHRDLQPHRADGTVSTEVRLLGHAARTWSQTGRER